MSQERMSAAEWRIDLPWPAKDLQPNERPHWAEKARATKAARFSAQWKAKPLGKINASTIKVTCIFSPPPPRRNRDLDNLIAACKPYFDGIADAIGIDDSHFQHQAPVWGIPRKGGNVCIVLEVA